MRHQSASTYQPHDTVRMSEMAGAAPLELPPSRVSVLDIGLDQQAGWDLARRFGRAHADSAHKPIRDT